MKKLLTYICFSILIISNSQSKDLIMSNYNFIAHAGGGIDKLKYTNSLEAISKSIKNGFKYIELDIHVSKDNKLVFLHDWLSFKKSTNFAKLDNNPMSYDDYIKSKIYNKYSVITVEKLISIFDKNKDLILVTDKIGDFDILINNIPFMERTIVEIFGKQNYLRSLFHKIPNRMLSTDLNSNDKIFIKILNIKYIAIHSSKVDENKEYLKKLVKKGVKVFAYSSNNENFILKNINKTVSAVYTDFWDIKKKNCSYNCVTY